MLKRNLTRFVVVSLLILTFASVAQAQATRTWVSGVGDDANPCSRTAPCKTFAGAISKTAAGGEISVLDPGGFGAVTITKSITLDGAGTTASILASGTNGIIINASNIVVTLRNLSINGAGNTVSPGLNGIRVLNAKTVLVENCVIFGFRAVGTGRAIEVAPPAGVTTSVMIKNSSMTDNSAAAIFSQPAAGGTARIEVVDSTLNANASAIFANTGTQATFTRAVITANTAVGIDAAGSSIVHVNQSEISFNPTGVQSGGTAQVRLSNNAIFSNATRGFNILGGTISTYGDNYFGLNGANVGVLTNAAADKQ